MVKTAGYVRHGLLCPEALDWAASPGGYDSDTVQDLMLRSVEQRFGSHLPEVPIIEWLTDNGSAYRAHETSVLARQIGLEPRITAVRSAQSNGSPKASSRQ